MPFDCFARRSRASMVHCQLWRRESRQEALVELLQGSLQRLLVALVQLFLTTCAIDLQARPAPSHSHEVKL